MRLSSQSDRIPYDSKTTCLLLVDKDGVRQIHSDVSPAEAYAAATSGDATIIAVWPGNWRTDAFLLDDLTDFARAFGLGPMQTAWRIVGYDLYDPSYDTKQSAFVTLHLEGEFGEPFLEADLDRILSEKFGWSRVKSKGWSQHSSADGTSGVSTWVAKSSIKPSTPPSWRKSGECPSTRPETSGIINTIPHIDTTGMSVDESIQARAAVLAAQAPPISPETKAQLREILIK